MNDAEKHLNARQRVLTYLLAKLRARLEGNVEEAVEEYFKTGTPLRAGGSPQEIRLIRDAIRHLAAVGAIIILDPATGREDVPIPPWPEPTYCRLTAEGRGIAEVVLECTVLQDLSEGGFIDLQAMQREAKKHGLEPLFPESPD